MKTFGWSAPRLAEVYQLDALQALWRLTRADPLNRNNHRGTRRLNAVSWAITLRMRRDTARKPVQP